MAAKPRHATLGARVVACRRVRLQVNGERARKTEHAPSEEGEDEVDLT